MKDAALALFGSETLDEMIAYSPPRGVGNLWIDWAAEQILFRSRDPEQLAAALVAQWTLARSFEAGQETHRWFDKVLETLPLRDWPCSMGARNVEWARRREWIYRRLAERRREEDG